MLLTCTIPSLFFLSPRNPVRPVPSTRTDPDTFPARARPSFIQDPDPVLVPVIAPFPLVLLRYVLHPAVLPTSLCLALPCLAAPATVLALCRASSRRLVSPFPGAALLALFCCCWLNLAESGLALAFWLCFFDLRCLVYLLVAWSVAGRRSLVGRDVLRCSSVSSRS